MTTKRVDPKEAQKLLDAGWTYVDVRSVPEFEAGHPKGAVNVPFLHAGAGGMQPNPDFLGAMKGNFKPDQKLVIGCMAGGRSAKAAAALEGEGFKNLADQFAGWGGSRGANGETVKGWAAEGLPVEAGNPEGRSWASVEKKKG